MQNPAEIAMENGENLMESPVITPKNVVKTGRNCKVFCCVNGCNSKGLRNRKLSFHLFPPPGSRKVSIERKNGIMEEVDARLAWIISLKIGKPVSKHMKVCSRHFKDEDFRLPCLKRKKMSLKKLAVPSCNLPTTKSERHRNNQHKPATRRVLNRSRTQREETNEQIPTTTDDSCEVSNVSDETSYPTQEDLEIANILCSLKVTHPEKAREKVDIGVQVTSGDIQHNFIDSLDTDKKLSTITGISTLGLLNLLTELVTDELNLRHKKTSKVNPRTRLFMTFMKLKANLSYAMLSIIFNSVVTPSMCRNIFCETIQILAYILQPAITFTSMDLIAQHRPTCFSDFPNVRVVLDCTEIHCEQPKCLCCQLRLYSSYKQTKTVKFLVGVAPSGLITFVSRAYGGRTSDKAIFEQSNLINKLTPGLDEIMVDKGFLIDDTCNIHRIKVVRPPFLKNKKQFTPEEAYITRKIAQARIHIERVNQRIKVFKMLSSTLPANLIHIAGEIFFVACAITNLSAPVLSPDRFSK